MSAHPVPSVSTSMIIKIKSKSVEKTSIKCYRIFSCCHYSSMTPQPSLRFRCHLKLEASRRLSNDKLLRWKIKKLVMFDRLSSFDRCDQCLQIIVIHTGVINCAQDQIKI